MMATDTFSMWTVPTFFPLPVSTRVAFVYLPKRWSVICPGEVFRGGLNKDQKSD